ncbi:ATP-grasp domain-containing protein [bacterium]|nr:ATP-grasp domain-containing protein [bacterium]
MPTVFIYELITAGGLFAVEGSPAPSGSLLREGMGMLSTIVEDFAAIDDVDVVVLRDARLEPFSCPGRQSVVADAEGEREAFLQQAKSCDFTMVIAPEFDRLMLDRTLWAEDAGATLLSPGSRFVEIASCKWRCFQRWREAGVSTIDTFQVADAASWHHLRGVPVVCKPSDGAGSDGVVSRISGRHLPDEILRSEKYLIQPKVFGDPLSCSIVGNGDDFVLLPPSIQKLKKDFKYHGGRLPVSLELAGRAYHLTRKAITAMPSFTGYAGLDMILGPCPDGSEDFAFDLNPRLTSSYLGLRQYLRNNLAKAMLDAAAGISFEPVTVDRDVDFEIL